jgi:hypothetical protein
MCQGQVGLGRKKKERKGNKRFFNTPVGFSSFHSNLKRGKIKPKTKSL